MTAATSLAVIPHNKPSNSRSSQASNSATFIAPLKTTLTPLENRKAVTLLSTRLCTGWVGYWKPRRYGKGVGIPNWCPKCGKSARELIKEAHRDYQLMTSPQIRTFMFSHAIVAH